jgi:hypothetical protein
LACSYTCCALSWASSHATDDSARQAEPARSEHPTSNAPSTSWPVKRHPLRWSATTRCWHQPEVVWINPPPPEIGINPAKLEAVA